MGIVRHFFWQRGSVGTAAVRRASLAAFLGSIPFVAAMYLFDDEF